MHAEGKEEKNLPYLTRRDLNKNTEVPATTAGAGFSFRFSRCERLSRKTLIDRLFSESQSVKSGGLSILYKVEQLQDTPSPAQAMFVVPKKNFRHAVMRNRLRRRLRECYRVLKETRLYPLLVQRKLQLAIAVIVISKKEETHAQLQVWMENCMDHLKTKLE